MSRSEFLNLAGICEGFLFALAFLLAWLLGVNPAQQFYFDWWSAAVGVLATIPLLLAFAVFYRTNWAPFRRIREMLLESFAPMLAECKWFDMILLALMAGLCEEVLFRGTIQLWLSQWGTPAAILGTSLLFGLVHCVTPAYVVLAAVIGAYLSWSMTFVAEQNLLVPIVTHAVYDYVAFLVIIAHYRKRVAAAEDA